MAENAAKKRPTKKSTSNVQPMPERPTRKVKPATTPESREAQLVNAAINLAEKQLLDGTASAAVITHYLKIATKREVMEREILGKQAKLLEAKANSIESSKDTKEMYEKAIESMKKYAGAE